MEKMNNFTHGKIFKPLVMFALPIMFSLLLQTMYGAVDLLVVGWFAQTPDVSGVTTGSQIMFTLTNLISGLSMGLTVILGHKIGEKKDDEAGEVIGSGLALFGAIALIVTVLVLLFSEQIVRLMRAPEEAFAETLSYVQICAGGTVFIVAFNLLGSVFRGIGDSKTPLVAVGIACVVNIVGDLLLVAIFKMGASGAAIATVAAQALSVLISLLILRRRKLPFTLTKASMRPKKEYTLNTLRLGFPIALQSMMTGVSFLVITAIVNQMGLIESAAIGVSEKMSGFVMLLPISFLQALSAYVAQNFGADKMYRARLAMRYSMIVSFCFGVIMAYLTFFHGELLAGLFNRTPEIIEATALYLKGYAGDTLLVSVLFCFTGYFNGCGKTSFVMAQTLLGSFLIRIPLSYYLSIQEGATLLELGYALPVSSIAQIVVCLLYYIHLNKKLKRDRVLENKPVPETV